MLSYFGTDQSQVQRYLSGKNVKEMQWGLLFNGALKIPMQFFILLVGVMVFVFYQFNNAPLHFNPAATENVQNSIYADEFASLQEQLKKNQEQQKTASLNYIKDPSLDVFEKNGEQHSYIKTYLDRDKELRSIGKDIIANAAPKVENNDKDYVFIHFILNNLPNGLIGLLLAVILSAAMSSTASELNALGATTAVDLYKRNYKGELSEEKYVRSTKGFTLMWGVLAIIVACSASLFENLIQLVNIIGSIFYGNILGVFLLAFFVKFVRSNSVFIAALITQVFIIILYALIHYKMIPLSYLWLNVIGCGIVMGIAILIQTLSGNVEQPETTA